VNLMEASVPSPVENATLNSLCRLLARGMGVMRLEQQDGDAEAGELTACSGGVASAYG